MPARPSANPTAPPQTATGGASAVVRVLRESCRLESLQHKNDKEGRKHWCKNIGEVFCHGDEAKMFAKADRKQLIPELLPLAEGIIAAVLDAVHAMKPAGGWATPEGRVALAQTGLFNISCTPCPVPSPASPPCPSTYHHRPALRRPRVYGVRARLLLSRRRRTRQGVGVGGGPRVG